MADKKLSELDELEQRQEGVTEYLSGKDEKEAEEPTKLPKKVRSGADESYAPMHGGSAH